MANGFGARGTLWVLVGIACLLYATMSVIDFVPRVVNLRKPLDPAREKIVWDETMAMVGGIKVDVCWMFAYLCLAMRNGMGLQVGLGWWFLSGDAGGCAGDLWVLYDEGLRYDSRRLTVARMDIIGETLRFVKRVLCGPCQL